MKEDNTNSGYRVVSDKKTSSTYKTAMLVLLVAFVTFIATSIGLYMYIEKSLGGLIDPNILKSKNTSTANIEETLDQYRNLIDKYYLKDVDEEKLKEGAIRGYIEGLGDEYTEYISPEEMKEYKNDLEGEFVGIGIYMVKDKESGKVRILTPTKDGPAYKAGVQPGDYIKSINGTEYSSDEMSKISDSIKGDGKEGNEVNLEVIREDNIIYIKNWKNKDKSCWKWNAGK